MFVVSSANCAPAPTVTVVEMVPSLHAKMPPPPITLRLPGPLSVPLSPTSSKPPAGAPALPTYAAPSSVTVAASIRPRPGPVKRAPAFKTCCPVTNATRAEATAD